MLVATATAYVLQVLHVEMSKSELHIIHCAWAHHSASKTTKPKNRHINKNN